MQAKVPPSVQTQHVGLSGRSRQRAGSHVFAALHGVVAAEIHRLAQLGNGIRHGSAPFRAHQVDQFGGRVFQTGGGLFQDARTPVGTAGIPGGLRGSGPFDGAGDVILVRLQHLTDQRAVGRRAHVTYLSARRLQGRRPAGRDRPATAVRIARCDHPPAVPGVPGLPDPYPGRFLSVRRTSGRDRVAAGWHHGGKSFDASTASSGSRINLSTGTASSRNRFTKELLAPFSSRPPDQIRQQILVRSDRRVHAQRQLCLSQVGSRGFRTGALPSRAAAAAQKSVPAAIVRTCTAVLALCVANCGKIRLPPPIRRAAQAS